MNSSGIEDQNFLHGVQVADDQGRLSFTSIFPACYDGRWPHAHLEVYPTLEDATSASGRLRTTQLALPQEVCERVYREERYSGSAANLARVSLDTDLVFADGHTLQLAKVAGSVGRGYVASLNVPV